MAQLYEVTLQSTYKAQECINRWNYLSSGTPAAVSGSFGLAFAFGILPQGTPPLLNLTSVYAGIRDLVSADVEFIQLIVRAIYDPLDFYTTAAPQLFKNGMVGGQAATPALAYGFVSSRTRTDISRATKRFAGVSESYMESGGTLIPEVLTLMNTLATRMAAVLSYDDSGNTITYAPVVVKKEPYTTERGNRAYRYFPTIAEQTPKLMQSIQWQPQTTIRTQTSRQYR